ncbi:VOC family protein [Sphingomonas sp. BAUL-RG-20F-R05-02]|uniref:VOC family protein n=1 Tax=Sphingomonas sp. BAUL-RG-20F-R05-02 TaxID=2914830 RepID=UPI001F58C410|nr:VOC family protein [Sphingomonas sp. BAUL-RG-20F-R05-02]
MTSNNFLIESLRSVQFQVPDLARAEAFYTEVWGLSVADRDDDRLWLRGTGDDSYLLGLRAGGVAAIRDMTFRAASAEALERLAARIREAGLAMVKPVGLITNEPAGGTGFAFADPRGRTIRIVHGDHRPDAAPLQRDRPERLAHVNINSTDVDADVAFFEEQLGFRLTDRSKMMGFVRTNSDHHSVVIAQAPVDTLNHVAFLLPSWEGVMVASGRLVDNGFPIAWGVGRHGPGDNVFAYFVDPFGFVVEHTAEVLQVDDDYRVGGPQDWTWAPGRTDQWGIAPPKSDACTAAQLAIPFTLAI